MKKVFRFKYDSIPDYIEKTNIIFFHIPYIARKGFTIPLPFFKFERDLVLLHYLLQTIIQATNLNLISHYSDLLIDFSNEFKFSYNLNINTDFLKNLGLKENKLQNFEILL